MQTAYLRLKHAPASPENMKCTSQLPLPVLGEAADSRIPGARYPSPFPQRPLVFHY